MQVMDIVNRAAIASGAAPSFNVDEVPEDMQARGADILRYEIIPTLNCDRTVDITEIVYPTVPKQGVISLRTTPLDYPRYIIPTAPYTAQYLQSTTKYPAPGGHGLATVVNLLPYLVEEGYVEGMFNHALTEKWPTDQLGQPLDLAIWTDDTKLIEIPSDLSKYFVSDGEVVDWVSKRYNVPFAPMRVTEIARAADGAMFQYIHAGEMISSEFRYSPLVFTTEDLPEVMKIRFNPSYSDEPVLLVLPVPVKVVNSYDEPNPWQGTIVAPEKFRMFIQAVLTWRMAGEYGLASEARFEKLAEKAYDAIIKNMSKQPHAQDIPRRISQYLGRNRGWRAGANGSGYVGGYNG